MKKYISFWQTYLFFEIKPNLKISQSLSYVEHIHPSCVFDIKCPLKCCRRHVSTGGVQQEFVTESPRVEPDTPSMLASD